VKARFRPAALLNSVSRHSSKADAFTDHSLDAAQKQDAGGAGTRAPSLHLHVAFLLFAAAIAAATMAGLAAPPAASAAGCPNEALRAENNSLDLAPCRAYERVTPSFQNGFGVASPIAIAPDGEDLIIETLAGFAGAESSRLGPYYKMSRTNTGWQTASISPPASSFPASAFFTASADLGRSLWALRSPGESVYAQSLYLREPDGSFVEIGPMVPPSAQSGPPANGSQVFLGTYEFRGASSDLSHVYFSITNGAGHSVLWPGDTTTLFGSAARAESLYEYSGVGNTRPALVGVEGQGHLISDCATFLGSDEYHETYNAVSADGKKVFFTADGHDQQACPEEIPAPEVTEVYARVDGQETVAVSEPSRVTCEECNTTARRGAQFQGASADGSRVFFTTTQELLPGAETNNLFEYDFNSALGRRVRRVSIGASAPEVLGVSRISQDGSHVYFVARGRLTDAPRGGCIAEETPSEQVEEELTHEGRCRPPQGQPNLYVYTREGQNPLGQVNFLATLAESESDESIWSPEDRRPVQATPDGRHLVFLSTAALTPGVTGEGRQVYEYDAHTEELIRVSRGQNGYPQGTENANNSFANIELQSYFGKFQPTKGSTYLEISEDGSDIQFSSPAALTPANEEAAAAGVTSVYEYRSDGPIANGDVSPLSTEGNSQAIGISPNGRNAFIKEGDPLVAGQTDSQLNIFDARQDGGFSAPAAPTGCLGEACLQGAPPPPLEPPPPGSLAATEGNGPPPAHKKKHKKHHTKKHKKHKGSQKSKQRAGSKHGGQK
jgi:hypothetical protein